MKMLLAGLLGLVLSVVCAVPSMAQNKQGRYDSAAVSNVNYTLNSGSSFYGQLFNSLSTSTGAWTLGFGSSQNSAGTAVLSWNSMGHVEVHGVQAPGVSACATTPSVAVGSDNAGDVTIGKGGAQSTCTLTFAAPFANIPHCTCSDRTTNIACVAQATLSTVVLVPTGSSSFASVDVLDYICLGHN